MKRNLLFKLLPFLFTVIVIIFLTLNNQKQKTKLKIVIWDTPTLNVGTYIALSTLTGFIMSYLITYNISNLNQPKLRRVIKYNINNDSENPQAQIHKTEQAQYANTLIEREVNDTSPTINAKFRVISNIKTKYSSSSEQYSSSSEKYSNFNDDLNPTNFEEDEISNKSDSIPQPSYIDWYDDSYSKW